MASEGYRFGEWLGEGIADRSLPGTTVTISADSSATARFVKVWNLGVTAGEGGTVEGGGTFDDGAEVAVSAMPSEGFTFVRWEGSDSIADPNVAKTSVTVSETLTLTAIFMRMDVELMLPDRSITRNVCTPVACLHVSIQQFSKDCHAAYS